MAYHTIGLLVCWAPHSGALGMQSHLGVALGLPDCISKVPRFTPSPHFSPCWSLEFCPNLAPAGSTHDGFLPPTQGNFAWEPWKSEPLLLVAFHSGFLWATLWGTQLARLVGGVPAFGSNSQEIASPPPFNQVWSVLLLFL